MARAETMQERFAAYHARHPDVFGLFRRFAAEARAAGRARFGARAIMERIRWHYAVVRHDGEPFKINDSFTSRYARLLIEEDPGFAGFFELRRLREGGGHGGDDDR